MSQDNILSNNYCFSKVLKDFDFKIRFRNLKEEKSLYILLKVQRERRERKIFEENKKNHKQIVEDLKRAQEESELLKLNKVKKLRGNNSSLNVISTRNNHKYFLPDLSRREEQKSRNKNLGFVKIWNQHVNKSKKKGRNSSSVYRTMYVGNNSVNIFDKNYGKLREKIEKMSEKNVILNRIKLNNLKVKNKLKKHHDLLNKWKAKKEDYIPNYSVIEKHQPFISLNTKSQRIFPLKFIRSYNSKEPYTPYKIDGYTINQNNLRYSNPNTTTILSKIGTCSLFKNYIT